MNGHVDNNGRALLTVTIQPSAEAATCHIEAWIDTGFNGDLILPQQWIDDLGLLQSGTVMGMLADGSEIVLDQYVCWIDWFGEQFDLEVIANEGEYPLLGVGLLADHDLHISYRSGEVGIT